MGVDLYCNKTVTDQAEHEELVSKLPLAYPAKDTEHRFRSSWDSNKGSFFYDTKLRRLTWCGYRVRLAKGELIEPGKKTHRSYSRAKLAYNLSQYPGNQDHVLKYFDERSWWEFG